MSARPATLDVVRPIELDVRDDIAQGVEPFGKIMAAVKRLGDGEALVLRAPFEPVPLYGVLGRRGFTHWAESGTPGDWSIWFYRGDAAGAPAPSGITAAPREQLIDVRGLEAPQPMVQVLARLDAIGPGDTLVVLHDRRPLFLYPQLDDRGFVHETDEPEPNLVRIRIRRAAP